MIKLVKAQCPKCGAIMEVPERLYYVSCIRCKSKVIVPKNSGVTEFIVSPWWAMFRELPGGYIEKLILFTLLILFPVSIYIIFFTDLYLESPEFFCGITFIAILSSLIIIYNIKLAFDK
jgi:DNA-directed RNA polymerase subunit RPC12/RpoP